MRTTLHAPLRALLRRPLHALLRALLWTAAALPFTLQAQQPALHAQRPLDSVLPVRGFCIDAPRPSRDVFQRIDALGN
jgi:hypothetical protein